MSNPYLVIENLVGSHNVHPVVFENDKPTVCLCASCQGAALIREQLKKIRQLEADAEPCGGCGHGSSYHKHGEECRFEDCLCRSHNG